MLQLQKFLSNSMAAGVVLCSSGSSSRKYLFWHFSTMWRTVCFPTWQSQSDDQQTFHLCISSEVWGIMFEEIILIQEGDFFNRGLDRNCRYYFLSIGVAVPLWRWNFSSSKSFQMRPQIGRHCTLVPQFMGIEVTS